jgi:murein L,D-transpeptidase YafK
MARRILIVVAVVVVGALSIAAAVVFFDEFQEPLPLDAKADSIVVEKHAHRMTLYMGDWPLRTYRVALSRGGMPPKAREGDLLVPEGTYILRRREKSRFYRAFAISYPNDADKAAGRTGGNIELHGLPKGLGFLGPLHRAVDWTAGCIAVTNREMDEIWRAVNIDKAKVTPIEIKP